MHKLRRFGLGLAPVVTTAVLATSLGSGVATGADQKAPDFSGLVKALPRDPLEVALEQQQLREERARPEAKELRLRSRTAFSGMSRDETAELARQQWPELFALGRRLAPPALDDKKLEFVGTNGARVKSAAGRTEALLDSLAPLRAKNRDGKLEPVDYGLRTSGKGFSPINSAVPVWIPSRASGSLRLERLGLDVRLGGDSEGTPIGDQVLHPEVAVDTDRLTSARPDGAQVVWQLRSAKSPETFGVELDLPAGAETRLAEEGQLEIVKDAEVLTTITMPIGTDSDGQRVPARWLLDGRAVRLAVDHRSGDVRYPLLIDPWVIDHFQWRTQGGGFSPWQYHASSATFGQLQGNGGWGYGQYLWAKPNTFYNAGLIAQWYYSAPGQSFITRVDFASVFHSPARTAYYAGIYAPNVAAWEGWALLTGSPVENTYHTHCVASNCSNYTSGQPGNAAVFGLTTTQNATDPNYGIAYVGYPAVYLVDNTAPAVDALGLNGVDTSKWISGPRALHVRTSDVGVGARAVFLNIDVLQDQQPEFISDGADDGCEVLKGDACATAVEDDLLLQPEVESLDPTIWEGLVNVRPVGMDGFGNFAAGATTTLKYDLTPPVIEEMSGPLAVMNGQQLDENSYSVKVKASDPSPSPTVPVERSGIKLLKLHLTGVSPSTIDQDVVGPVNSGQTGCPGAACTFESTLTFQPYAWNLPPGKYQVHVEAHDHAGHITRPEHPIEVTLANGLTNLPLQGERTVKRLRLKATAGRSGPTTATFVYRRSPSDSWQTIPQSHITTIGGAPVSTTAMPLDANRATAEFEWDVQQTLGTDGNVEVRAHLNGDANQPTSTRKAVLESNRLGSQYAHADIGPGRVNLASGNFVVTEDDAVLDSFAADLAVSRSYLSRAANADASAPLGPGWILSTPVDEASADYVKITRPINGDPTLQRADGTLVRFGKKGQGFEPETGSEHLKLEADGTSFRLTDADQNLVNFTRTVAGSSSPPADEEHRPVSARTPANATTTSFTYGANGRIERALGPVPAGVNCSTLVPGCRELTFDYATSTTATGTTEVSWGDFQGRLKSVTFRAPTGTATNAQVVSTYRYDNAGRLRAQWDPRISPALKTTYAYNSGGVLSQVTPPGEASWNLAYQAVGTDTNSGRLRSVSRTGPQGTATETVIYDVPRSGTAAPYSMGPNDVSAWAQTDVPSDATALFPADVVPPSGTVTDFSRATVHYLNSRGLETNTAEPGGRIDVTEHDAFRNVRRTLTARNRATAVQASSPAVRAGQIDTQSVYDADGLELVSVLEPQHQVQLPDGTNVQARKQTLTTYDEGLTTGDPHLPTMVRVSAVKTDGTETDVRVTKHKYENGALVARQPSETIVDPDGLKVVSRASYDQSTGLELSRTQPKGDTQDQTTKDRQTTVTDYYKAGAASNANCANKPEWAGRVCSTGRAAQPGGSLAASQTRGVSSYTPLGQVEATFESNGTHARLVSYAFDAAGRQTVAHVEASTGTALPDVTTSYNADTGRVARTTTSSGYVERSYDTLGRLTAFRDSHGQVSTTTYDLLNRPVTTDDGKGTQTRSYNATSGDLTGLQDSQAGALSATYDADGAVATRGYPNGLTATLARDETAA